MVNVNNPFEDNNSLTVRDNRTGKTFVIPYVRRTTVPLDRLPFVLFHSIADNSITATAFKTISAPRSGGEREENQTHKGLRVVDQGFLNTAVIRSRITYIDGEAGSECIVFYHLKISSEKLPSSPI
jgi:citrate synthase